MPSLALTFDDLFVDNWLAARPVFDAFNARVTFCVSHIHTASETQIAELIFLQADGHEIAYHSRTHPKLKPYLDEHGLDHWLEHEIDAGVAEHRALGFPATSFASPFHQSTAETRAACAHRFAITRTDGPRSVNTNNIEDRIYTRPGPDNTVDNLGFADIQHHAFPGWPWQIQLLDRIAEHGGTGVFTGHDIRGRKSGPGFYSTHRQLRRLLQAAADRGIRFQTLSEFALGRNSTTTDSTETAPNPAAAQSATR